MRRLIFRNLGSLEFGANGLGELVSQFYSPAVRF